MGGRHESHPHVKAGPMSQPAAQQPHPLDEAIRLERMADGRLLARTSERYWNFGAPFGGATAAVLMQAVLGDPRRIGDPLSITVNYCAAIAKGAFDVTLREVRTNRSTQHWYVELTQPGQGVAANATVVCAVRRKTWSHLAARPPAARPPEEVPVFPTSGLSVWLERYEFRFSEGAPELGKEPSATPASARSVVWLNDRPARPLDFASVTALSDAFFGRIFHARRAVFPISTVSMTTAFHVDGAGMAALGSEPLLGLTDAHLFEQGFFDQTAELWSRAGKLVATSTQMVYFRD
jgi:acyl-coenzyme A thioesterase PaaI-like protein